MERHIIFSWMELFGSLHESCTYVLCLLVYCMELGEERTGLDSMCACLLFYLCFNSGIIHFAHYT